MKVIIPENRLEQILFNYLDLKFKDLEQYPKGKYYDILFKIPGEEYGVLVWKKSGNLSIKYKLIDNIFSFIPIKKTKIEKIIGRYVESRYNLEVIYTITLQLRIAP